MCHSINTGTDFPKKKRIRWCLSLCALQQLVCVQNQMIHLIFYTFVITIIAWERNVSLQLFNKLHVRIKAVALLTLYCISLPQYTSQQWGGMNFT